MIISMSEIVQASVLPSGDNVISVINNSNFLQECHELRY